MMKLNSWNSKIGLIQKNSIKEYISVKKDISFTDKCIKVNKKTKNYNGAMARLELARPTKKAEGF